MFCLCSSVMSRCTLRALTAYEILLTLQDSPPGFNIVEKQYVLSTVT